MVEGKKEVEEMEDVGDRDLAKGIKLKKIDRNKGRYIEKDEKKERNKNEKAQGRRVAG